MQTLTRMKESSKNIGFSPAEVHVEETSVNEKGSDDVEINKQEEDLMNKLRQTNKKSKKHAALEMLKMIKSTEANKEKEKQTGSRRGSRRNSRAGSRRNS